MPGLIQYAAVRDDRFSATAPLILQTPRHRSAPGFPTTGAVLLQPTTGAVLLQHHSHSHSHPGPARCCHCHRPHMRAMCVDMRPWAVRWQVCCVCRLQPCLHSADSSPLSSPPAVLHRQSRMFARAGHSLPGVSAEGQHQHPWSAAPGAGHQRPAPASCPQFMGGGRCRAEARAWERHPK